MIKKYNITFEVNYYTELLGVIGVLSDNQDAICDAGVIRCNEWYHQEILNYFSQFKDHKIIKLLEIFSDEYNFNYDAPVELVLRLSNNLTINKDELCRARKYIEDNLFNEFINQIKDFDYVSNFKEFYNSHQQYYLNNINTFIQDYEVYKPLDWLLNKLGLNEDMKFRINLVHSITNGNYGLLLDDTITINIRPYYKTRNTSHPDFSYSKIYWTTLVVHEFAHGFVNPLVKKYRNDIEKIDIIPYQEKLKELCYGEDLETFINENIIRSIECLYVKEYFKDFYDEYLNDNLEEGYDNIPEITEALKESNFINIDILAIIKLFSKHKNS